jgi:hypothetical protein
VGDASDTLYDTGSVIVNRINGALGLWGVVAGIACVIAGRARMDSVVLYSGLDIVCIL